MKWKGIRVTSLNYEDLFSDYSLDVQDEVRSALLDRVDIAPLIEKYGRTNPAYIHQVRLAVKQGLDKDWLQGLRSDRVLSRVRALTAKGVDLSYFKRYLGKGLVESTELTILDLLEAGYPLEKYNFLDIPEHLLPIIDRGIRLRKPLYLFTENLYNITPRYIQLVLGMLAQGRDVDEFLDVVWPEETLELLSKVPSLEDYNQLLEYVYPEFSPELVEVLVEMVLNGLPLERFTLLEDYPGSDEIIPLYNPLQLSWVLQAHQEGLDWSILLDPNMGNEELALAVRELRFEKGKKLSGRLHKRLPG